MTLKTDVRKKLQQLADEDFKKFNSKICCDEKSENMIGVRIPLLRKFAKEIARESAKEYLDGDNYTLFEEKLLFGFVLSYAKLTEEEQSEYYKKFYIICDNWAVCDCCCSSFKFIAKNKELYKHILLPYLHSEKEYEVRLAVVTLMNYFLTDDYKDFALDKFTSVTHEGYYVQMAVAWALSTAYIKYPDEVETILGKKILPKFTHNKAISKICDSLRVDKKKKEHIKEYRVK